MCRIGIIVALLFVLSACSESEQARQAALLDAAEKGNLPRIQALLDDDTNVNTRDACFFTPLMNAASNGNLDGVEMLLLAGARVEDSDKGGYTALLLAASKNHHDVVKRLLAAGADIDHQEKTQGWSALIWAANLGHYETVEVLLAHGVNTTLRDFKSQNALQWAQKNRHESIIRLLHDR